MIVHNSVKCSVCGKVFCCLKCRFKHEESSHADSSCPICHNQKIILRSSIDIKLINHIAENHLPLHCIKCSKVYVNTSDMLNITNCLESKTKCSDKITASSVTQPTVKSLLDNKELTPSSMVTVQWKIRNKISEDYIGESLSLLKNISFINNSVPSRNENDKGTVVRSTSTPMQGAVIHKQKETVFDSSGNHVSSIYASGSELEVSPPIIIFCRTPTSPKLDIIADRISKHHLGIKKPVTPLRQIMSNSIRRAITQHGMENLKNEHLKPKKIFDYSGSPLDLRTSPALRRVQSEKIERSYSFDNFDSSKTSTRKSFSISSKQTTESILIKSITKSSVYTTCRSISVITSTELQEVSVEKENNKSSTCSVQNSVTFTPKVGGVKKKKTIDFETPIHVNTVNDDDDVFYTPMSMLANKSEYANTSENEFTDDYTNASANFDNINEHCKSNQIETIDNKATTGGKIWSMITSMVHKSAIKKPEQKDNSQSFIKRCASFAGYISKTRNPSDEDNEFQSLKRRRNTATDSIETAAKRLKRIQGRKPISRMRNLSIENDLCKPKI